MVNFGPLAAEICWRVWGTPTNFNGFRVLASLLHRRRSTEVNQTLRDVWPSPRLLQYIHFGRVLTANGILPPAKIILPPKSCVLLYWQCYCMQSTRAVGVSQCLRRGTRNGITELLQRAPPTFGRAAITLGIGPHSSFNVSL